MKAERSVATSVDSYIAAFPKEIRDVLERVRRTIQKAAPKAEATICYRIPTFKYRGNLVHFAAWKTHIGFYPTPSGILQFARELSPYVLSRGTVQFPLDRPIPLGLIRCIVQFRMRENEARAGRGGGIMGHSGS